MMRAFGTQPRSCWTSIQKERPNSWQPSQLGWEGWGCVRPVRCAPAAFWGVLVGRTAHDQRTHSRCGKRRCAETQQRSLNGPKAGRISHHSPRAQMYTFEGPGLHKNHQISTRKHTVRDKKSEIGGGRGTKSAKCWVPHPSGPPPLRGPTFRASTLWGPTLRGPTFRGPIFSGFGPHPLGHKPDPEMDWPKLDWPKLVKSGWPKLDWPKRDCGLNLQTDTPVEDWQTSKRRRAGCQTGRVKDWKAACVKRTCFCTQQQATTVDKHGKQTSHTWQTSFTKACGAHSLLPNVCAPVKQLPRDDAAKKAHCGHPHSVHGVCDW